MLPLTLLADEQAVRARRLEAQDLIDNNQATAAVMVLNKARSLTHTIADPYSRTNELRYIGELYFKAGETKTARVIFGEAMDTALATTPWYRGLSAVIAVVEIQQRLGDKQYLRKSGMSAIDGGLLQRLDKARGDGEIRRFFAALDGVLVPADVENIMMRLRNVGYAPLRRKILYSLHEITLLQPEGISTEYDDKTTPEILQRFPTGADSWEQGLWYAVLARLVALRGDEFNANRYMEKAKTLLQHADGVTAEKAAAIIRRVRGQVEGENDEINR